MIVGGSHFFPREFSYHFYHAQPVRVREGLANALRVYVLIGIQADHQAFPRCLATF